MKKQVTTVLACLAMVCAFAQPTEKPKDEVDVKVEGNRITIEADDLNNLKGIDLNKLLADVYKRSTEVEKQRANTYARIDRQLAAGEIDAEEASELKEDADERAEESLELMEDAMESYGDAYEARWEAWADEFEAKMDAWEVEMDAREGTSQPVPPMPQIPPIPQMTPKNGESAAMDDDDRTVIINEEGIKIKRKKGGEEPFALRFNENDDEDNDDQDKPEKSKKIDRTDGYFDIHFGFNQQLRNGNALIAQANNDALDFWKSTSFNIGTGLKSRIGNPYSKFYIKYGIDLSFHNFRLEENNILQSNPTTDEPEFVEGVSGNNYEKSKYFMSYVNLPVMFQLDFSEVGQRDEAFTLGAGGYVGIRWKTKTEVEFSNTVSDDVEVKNYDSFFTNRIRYGVMAQVGWESFKITASYDLNTFFEDGFGPNYNMLNLTLGFTI